MWTEISNMGYKFTCTGSVGFLHLRLCVMSTFVTPSALDTDRVAKLLLNFYSWMQEYVRIQKLYLYRTIFMLLSHISSSLGHLFFQVREPALGITYITDIPEPIVLHKNRGYRRCWAAAKQQNCRIWPLIKDNFCRFLVFPATRCQGPCF